MKTKKISICLALILALIFFSTTNLLADSNSSVTSNTSVTTLIITGSDDSGNGGKDKHFVYTGGSHPFSAPAPTPVGLPATLAWNEASMKTSIFALGRQEWTIKKLRIIAQVNSNRAVKKTTLRQRAIGNGDRPTDYYYFVSENKDNNRTRTKETSFQFRTYKPWNLTPRTNTDIEPEKKVYILLAGDSKKVISFEDSLSDSGKKTIISGEASASAYTIPDEIVARIVLKFVEENTDVDGVIVNRYGFEKEQHSDSGSKDFSPTISIGGVNVAGAGLGGITSNFQILKRKSLAYVQVFAFKIVNDELSEPMTRVLPTQRQTTPVVSSLEQLHELIRGLTEENSKLNKQLTKQAQPQLRKIKICPASIKFYFNRYIPVAGQEKKFARMADWFVQNWSKLIKQGDPALIGHADRKPKNLSARKDRINPWIAMQRAVITKILLVPELRKRGMKKEQIDKIKVLSASNLWLMKPKAQTEEDRQKNRQVFAVTIVGHSASDD